jgi:pimeloyl-ACP methyl ester carboxylesterase
MTAMEAACDETPIWSSVIGDGDTLVVLVHGSLDRSAGLLKLSRRLDRDYRVARYDRRGYGRSAPHPGPFDMAHQVDDLATIIARHRRPTDRACIVVGHSYGGNVALATADRRPDLLDAVVTYESPLSWFPWWGGGAGSSAAARADNPADAAEAFMRRLVGDERWERLPPSTRDARRAEGPAMLGELADLKANAPWTADHIRVPVLCLYGERGRLHHRRGARELATMLPDAASDMIPGAHHFGPNTHPDEVAAVVNPFIERVVGQDARRG